jgi:hypothetical protein
MRRERRGDLGQRGRLVNRQSRNQQHLLHLGHRPRRYRERTTTAKT